MLHKKGRDNMDIMDIAALSTSMSRQKNMSDLGIAILGKTLDSAKQIAAGEVAMLDEMPRAALETSVNPAVGSNIDVSV